MQDSTSSITAVAWELLPFDFRVPLKWVYTDDGWVQFCYMEEREYWIDWDAALALRHP